MNSLLPCKHCNKIPKLTLTREHVPNVKNADKFECRLALCCVESVAPRKLIFYGSHSRFKSMTRLFQKKWNEYNAINTTIELLSSKGDQNA